MANKEDKKMRVIEAVYQTERLYQIPEEWDIKDVHIKYGALYYKGVLQEDIKNVDLESDFKFPLEIVEHDGGLEYMFDADVPEEAAAAGAAGEEEDEKQSLTAKSAEGGC